MWDRKASFKLALIISIALLLAAPLSAASEPSDDDLWDDGFGFGKKVEDYFDRVQAIAVMGNDVYVGGRFLIAGDASVNGIARWDGKSWSNVGGGLDNCRGIFCFPTVYTLQVRGADLYAGGNFASVGGVPANRVARWDGNKWSALGEGVQICDRFNDCVTVLAIATTPNEIYAVGRIITDVYSNNPNEILDAFTKWDGSQWAVQSGVIGISYDVSLRAIEVENKNVYVGGNFTAAGFTSANHIARWDGREWAALGSGIEGCNITGPGQTCAVQVYTIAAVGKDIYVGGGFKIAGSIPVNNIAKWDGGKWSALGDGANGPVYKIAANGNNIFVGGKFTSIGGIQANGIAKFDGSKWTALGSGVDGYVNAIAFKGAEVYVGGSFTKAGGKTANNFARWIDPLFVPPAPQPDIPKITGISIVRKKLIVAGEKFAPGAVILLNGEKQKTQNDEQNPTTKLIAKKSGKKVRTGDILQVQNPGGQISPELVVAR